MLEFCLKHLNLEEEFTKATSLLFDKKYLKKIVYRDCRVESFDLHNEILLKEIANKSILYCLWYGESEEELMPVYLGHAHKTISRQRMRAHLTKKNKFTGSKLELVTKGVKQGHFIGLSYIVIKPCYMRKALEEWAIENYPSCVLWNKVGKGKSV